VARWRVLAATTTVLAAAVLVLPALGAKPTIERIEVDETFADEFLTEVCGFPVTSSAQGHIIVRESSREGTGVIQLRTLNIALTATANGKTYRFRDVGADLVRRTPDGFEILMVVGQIPFDFTGLLKVNTTTGEVILEPRHSTAAELEKVCAALAPA
jgi:hypothetical protein